MAQAPATPPDPRDLPPRVARALLGLALLLFGGLGSWQAATFPILSEELVMHPLPARAVLAAPPGPSLGVVTQPTCADPDAPRILVGAQRPFVSLCLDGRAYPILVAPYFAGYPYWPTELLRPWHGDDPLRLRQITLVIGLLSLLLTWRLAARVAGTRLATMGVLATAVSPLFVTVHASLAHHETLPWLMLVAGLLAFTGCRGLAPARTEAGAGKGSGSGGGQGDEEGRIPTGRLALGGLALGLAVAANVKTAFLVPPFALLALRLGVRWRRVRPLQWAAVLAAGAVPLLPFLWILALDPGTSLTQGRMAASGAILDHLADPAWLAARLRDVVVTVSSVRELLRADGVARLDVPGALLALGLLAFALARTVRTLVRPRGEVVTAAVGLYGLALGALGVLLYKEPPYNFSPLHVGYGFVAGAAIVRLAALLPRQVHRGAGLAAVAVAVMAPLAATTIRTATAWADLDLPINVVAEQEAAAHLQATAPDGPVYTREMMLGGVVDALTGGKVATVQAHPYFTSCVEAGRVPGVAEQCMESHWRALLRARFWEGPVHVLLPTDVQAFGRPFPGVESTMEQDALARAARGLGRDLQLVRTFATPSGTPVLVHYRVSPSPGG